MNCTDFLDRLDEALTGDLDAETMTAMDAHRAICEDCRREHATAVEIGLRVRQLPRSIPPGRDLWPGISGRIEAERVVRASFGRQRPHVPAARWRIAAAAAVVLVAVAVAYHVGRLQAPRVVAGATPEAASRDVLPAGFEAGAVLDLERQVATIRGQLLDVVANQEMDPATVKVVMENLGLIDDAVGRIERALADDPGNPRLTRQLAFAYRQELDLLRRVARLPADV